MLLQVRQGQAVGLQLSAQILGNGIFFVLFGSDIEGFGHHPGSTVGVELTAHLLPELAVFLGGQEILLPGAMEKGPGFESQTIDYMPIIDAAGSTFGTLLGDMNSG